MSPGRLASGGIGLSVFWCLSLVVLVFALALATAVGEFSIALKTVFLSVSNGLGLTDVQLSRIEESVIWNLRLSRALVAALCGAGLAICGVILQSLLRNPLAEPFVLGVSAGASTGAVCVIILGVGSGALSLSLGAFVGAFAAFAFVALLSKGATRGANLTILAGVAASQLFNALTAYIVATSANAQQARDIMFWMLGSFGGVRWPDFYLLLGVVTICLILCVIYARILDAFTFGDEDAAALGISVTSVRLIMFTVTAFMTACIVSIVGAIGFVGLVVPHAVRYIVGPGHMKLLPAAAMAGAIFMVLADLASRILVTQQALPIGIVTALVGVPFFSVLLYRSR